MLLNYVLQHIKSKKEDEPQRATLLSSLFSATYESFTSLKRCAKQVSE